MDLSKKELLIKCDKLGITKCKSKSKDKLLQLIHTRNDNNHNNSNDILVVHTTNVSPLRYPG